MSRRRVPLVIRGRCSHPPQERVLVVVGVLDTRRRRRSRRRARKSRWCGGPRGWKSRSAQFRIIRPELYRPTGDALVNLAQLASSRRPAVSSIVSQPAHADEALRRVRRDRRREQATARKPSGSSLHFVFTTSSGEASSGFVPKGKSARRRATAGVAGGQHSMVNLVVSTRVSAALP